MHSFGFTTEIMSQLEEITVSLFHFSGLELRPVLVYVLQCLFVDVSF